MFNVGQGQIAISLTQLSLPHTYTLAGGLVCQCGKIWVIFQRGLTFQKGDPMDLPTTTLFSN